ncbi:MAG: hypothetical protein ACTSWX_13145 [Promethearchaeota archaeon]
MAEYEKYESEIDQFIKNLKFFNDSSFRIQLFMMLNAYGEISLPELAKKMGKSKTTISKHLRLLDSELNWITIEEVKVRGNIKKKVYKMNIETRYSDVFWNLEKIVKSYPKEKVNKFLIKELKKKHLVFKMMDRFNFEAEQFIENNIKTLETMDQDLAKEYFLQNQIINYNTNLTKEEAEEYNKEMYKFHKNFIKKIEIKRLKEKDKVPIREYVAFQIVLPIKKMVESIQENKK